MKSCRSTSPRIREDGQPLRFVKEDDMKEGKSPLAVPRITPNGDTVERGFKIPEQGLGFRQEKNSNFQALISFQPKMKFLDPV
jgi:hypothetical protein